jgi:serine/threonine protein kinase
VHKAIPIRVKVGAFELDLKAGELCKDGRRTRLQEQTLQILLMLVERSGAVVTREEIKRKLWPNDTIVEFDHSIHTAVSKLRRALRDSAGKPKYIETVGRRGYRLIASVQFLESSTGDGSTGKGISSGHDREAAPVQVEQAGLIGKKVSHYRVLEVIGGGGMGMVYKAEDIKLGRRVALKFLPEELADDPVSLQRFEREARTASSLNHPNICTVHEVEEHDGQPFLVMELLEGQTLQEALASDAASSNSPATQAFPRRLLDLATQVLEGLEAAHEKGIIHRDIKPANLFVTTKGVVKILDFGLAKLLEGDSDKQDEVPAEPSRAADAAPPQLTCTSIAVGTAGYMSPEQIRREKLDTRTDLFSFGLVLYEMVTGQRAFAGETAAILKDAILSKEPRPVRALNSSAPLALERIIGKAIEKDRERRYQTASEMCAELRTLLQKRSVRKGGHERRNTLRVLFAASALLLLMVVTVLIGFRHKARGQIKQSHSGSPAAQAITGHVPRQVDRRAQDEYLQGKALFQNRDREKVGKAIEHFENALRYDSDYAPAIAALANCYIVAPFFSATAGNDAFAKARTAAQRALSLDDSLADAHLASAEVKLYGDWDFDGAGQEFKRAVELGPDEALTHQWYAEFLSLMSRHSEAMAEVEKALRVEPLSAVIHHQAGQVYLGARLYEKALEQYNHALKINPQFAASYDRMAYAFRRLGRIPEAIEAERRAANYWDPSGASARAIDGWAQAYATAGKGAYNRARLHWDKSSPSPSPLYYTAMKFAELGDKANAIAVLRRTLATRSSDVLNLRNDPEFDFMRSDPEFQRLLTEIGFPPVPDR